MSALKEIFSEPLEGNGVLGDMILATDAVAKFNRNHDKAGRFATTDAVVDGDDRPPQQVANLTAEDFAKGFSVPHHEYVRTDITKMNPLLIDGRPHLKVEGAFINDETGGRIGAFENLFGVDKQGEFFVDMVRVEILPGYQHEGIGADFTSQCEKFYKELGAKYVTLIANLTVGSLAWSLNGYDFSTNTAREVTREFFGNWLASEHKEGRLTEAQFVESVSQLSRLTHSWEFSTYGIPTKPDFGRKTMLAFGQAGGWEGRKDLDKASMGYKIGEAYQRLKIKRTAGK